MTNYKGAEVFSPNIKLLTFLVDMPIDSLKQFMAKYPMYKLRYYDQSEYQSFSLDYELVIESANEELSYQKSFELSKSWWVGDRTSSPSDMDLEMSTRLWDSTRQTSYFKNLIAELYGHQRGTGKMYSPYFGNIKSEVYQIRYRNKIYEIEIGICDKSRPGEIIKITNITNNESNNGIVQMQKTDGNVYEIPVTLNDVLKISFIFDSGASDVSVTPDVASTLIKTGTVKESDFIGTQKYVFADGSTAISRVFIIRSLTVGTHVVSNVRASISNSINAPMLLGQSVQQAFGNITIDNNTHTIKFDN